MRESVDERFSGYLLALAASAAEKQLRDQAMEAFPNSDFHERVDHFVDDMELSDGDEILESVAPTDGIRGRGPTRRVSSMDTGPQVQEKQRYREDEEPEASKLGVESERRQSKQIRAAQARSGPPSADRDADGAPKTIIGGWQKDVGLKKMRSAASPPMLGGDITFPRCPSPEPARFDVTQGSDAIRNNMCYLTNHAEGMSTEDKQCLWQGKESGASGRSSAAKSGLWGGFCQGDDPKPTIGLVGIVTPKSEVGDPFGGIGNSGSHTPRLPPSPARSSDNGVDARRTSCRLNELKKGESDEARRAERRQFKRYIEEEFSDSFVSQVFNYLSLGYPSLARKFDEELSKISKIPVEELREDDRLAQHRGYIRFGEDMDGEMRGQDGIDEHSSARWKALRIYVREWGLQQPKISPGGNPMGPWGVIERRGSWMA